VTLAGGRDLDDDLAATVQAAVRHRVSPRHVPDEVIQAPGIPHTRTGKKLEVPVKNILIGRTGAVQRDVVDEPELLSFYQRVGEDRRRARGGSR
jgi:acetoacetyl-CoA synthetase